MKKEISNIGQICSLKRVEVVEGKERGNREIYIANGVLNVILEENKCLDILQVYFKGKNTSFISKNGSPNNTDNFLTSFPGGTLYTCGLDSLGARENFPLHGHIHNIPSKIIQEEVNENYIKIVGLIEDTALFNQNLVLKRTIEIKTNSSTILINDELTNKGYRSENYVMLYHINSGYPLVSEKTKIKGEFISSISRTKHAEDNKKTMFIMEEPKNNEEECCYFHKQKKGEISLENEENKLKFTLKYSIDTLPNLVEWKSIASGDYVIGLEPTTCHLDDLFKYSKIKPGQTITNKIELIYEEI